MCKQRKILSYCLFQTSKKENRKWDKYQNVPDRYFVNIPFLLLTRDILFPQYTMVFHVDSYYYNHPLFELIKFASTKSEFIEIKVIENLQENDFAAASWRMLPFFDDRTDLLYCRDIDSLTTSKEFKTMMFFESADYKLYTNRSHAPGHKTDRIKILAGLCGFKPKEMTLGISYEEFVNVDCNIWIQDQRSLEKYFYGVDKKYFLDVPTRNLKIIELNEEKSSYWIEDLPINVKDFTDSQGVKYLEFLDSLTTWEGEPLDVRAKVDTFFSFSGDSLCIIKEIFGNNKVIREFYGK